MAEYIFFEDEKFIDLVMENVIMEFESNNLSMETIHLLNELDTDYSDLSAARRAKKELLQLDAQRKEHHDGQS